VLVQLANAAEALHEPPVSYAAFIAELSAAVGTARYGREEPTAGKIAVLPALAARGLHVEHVLLLGLNDGEFPLRLPEPPFYTRRERGLLARQGVPLPPPDPADEQTLFYEAVTRASTSLTLCRTRLDASGNELPASPYLASLLSLFTPGSLAEERIAAGSVPSLAEAVSEQERLIAAVSSWQLAVGSSNDDVRQLVTRNSQLVTHVLRAIVVERGREATGEYGPFEGMIADGEVQHLLAAKFGASHPWSVTQFNDYITCPFRFAAAHVLGLRPPAEPEAGIDRSTRGRLYHKILAEAGLIWSQRGLMHHPDNEAELLETLQAAADTVLADAPTTFGIQPDGFWNWEQDEVRRKLLRALRRFLRDGEDWSDFRSASVEASFGPGRPYAALSIATPAGEVQVAGRIDRIDQRDSDQTLALIDYKSSSTPQPLEKTLTGRDVQLAVYMLAVEEVIARSGQPVAQAAFLHLGSGKRSRALAAEQREQALAAMRERVAEAVQGARAGQFTVRPRDECPPACEFSTICRLNLRKRDS
jgi:ATP-dependent helicase/DNAse subunit B